MKKSRVQVWPDGSVYIPASKGKPWDFYAPPEWVAMFLGGAVQIEATRRKAVRDVMELRRLRKKEGGA